MKRDNYCSTWAISTTAFYNRILMDSRTRKIIRCSAFKLHCFQIPLLIKEVLLRFSFGRTGMKNYINTNCIISSQ